jgi:hypothetical protein
MNKSKIKHEYNRSFLWKQILQEFNINPHNRSSGSIQRIKVTPEEYLYIDKSEKSRIVLKIRIKSGISRVARPACGKISQKRLSQEESFRTHSRFYIFDSVNLSWIKRFSCFQITFLVCHWRKDSKIEFLAIIVVPLNYARIWFCFILGYCESENSSL